MGRIGLIPFLADANDVRSLFGMFSEEISQSLLGKVEEEVQENALLARTSLWLPFTQQAVIRAYAPIAPLAFTNCEDFISL